MGDGEDGTFQDAWIQDDQFQAWLVKVSNDPRRAYCRFCAIVLPANKGDLSAHGRTTTHTTNAKVAVENGVPTGPISVQIVSNDEADSEFIGPSGPGDEEAGGGGEQCLTPRTNYKRSPATGGKSYYIKRYRPAWEAEVEFKDWLTGYPEDVQRAFCKVCKAILRAHKHDLTCHARTARHLKKIQEYKEEHGGEQLFQMIAEDVVTIPQTNKRVAAAAAQVSDNTHAHPDVNEIGIEIDTSGIFPDDGHLVASGSVNKGPKVVKMPKATLNIKRESPTKPFSRKRPRLTAADVVNAIESNEFTGYELLQIVKVSVPKL